MEKLNWLTLSILLIITANLAIILNIPLLRPLLGSIMLLLVPGVLILKLFGFNNLNKIEGYSFAVALSITFLMFLGGLMNFFYPFMGITKPITINNLLITINFFLIMLLLAFFASKQKNNPLIKPSQNLDSKFLPILLYTIFIPLFCLMGMLINNYFGNNICLLLMLFFIVITVILVVFELIPSKYCPLIIFGTSIAIIFYGSLVTFHIAGNWTDMAFEFEAFNFVMMNGYWDIGISNNVNTLLSVTLLPAILSKLSNLSGEIIFRIVYPMVLSFVPMVLYRVYQKQTNEKIAFLSVFFFISMSFFIFSVPIISRMCIAELFFVLIILLITSEKLLNSKYSALLILFAASLAVSHYGITYFLIAYLGFFVLISIILLYIFGKNSSRGFKIAEILSKNRFTKIIGSKIDFLVGMLNKKTYRKITITFILFFFIFSLSWYIYVSQSHTFFDLVDMLNKISNSVFVDIFDPSSKDREANVALGMASLHKGSFLVPLNRYVWYITQIFSVIGFLTILSKKFKFSYEFIVFSFISFILLALSILMPVVSQDFSTLRIYHISLFFLAPLSIIGGLKLFKLILNRFKLNSKGIMQDKRLHALLLFILLPYFLFNTGFIFNFTEDVPPYTPLANAKYKNSNDIDLNALYLAYNIPEIDFIGAKWFSDHMDPNTKTYLDYTSYKYLLWPYPLSINSANKLTSIKKDSEAIKKSGNYIFLSGLNTIKNKIVTNKTSDTTSTVLTNYNYFETDTLQPMLEYRNKIYANGADVVYK